MPTSPSESHTGTEWLRLLQTNEPAVAKPFERLLAHPTLAHTAPDVARAYAAIRDALAAGGTLYLCGNGGSFADALHISGELLKSFVARRPLPRDLTARLEEQPFGTELATHLQAGLRAHVLGANPALSSAVANDIAMPGIGYAQELAALGREGDVLLGISTSGRSRNVLLALSVAKALGMTTIGLTGAAGPDNPLATGTDISLCVPERETSRVQELHIILYHQLCLMLEAHFFPE